MTYCNNGYAGRPGVCGTGGGCTVNGNSGVCGQTGALTGGALTGDRGGFSCVINLIIILIVLQFLSQLICGLQCGDTACCC